MTLSRVALTGGPRFAWLVVVLLAGMASAHAASNDFPALEMIASTLPDAQVVAHASKDFATYPLITERIDQRGGIKGNISSTRTIEGNLGRTVYKFADAQAAGVIAAVQESLSAAGFKA